MLSCRFTASSNDYTNALERICDACHKSSPQVYSAGWMCLHPACKAFWHLPHSTPVPDSLEYSPAFLRHVPLDTDSMLEDLRPGPPVLALPNDMVTTSRHFCKGFHCTKCGRLSCRYAILSYTGHVDIDNFPFTGLNGNTGNVVHVGSVHWHCLRGSKLTWTYIFSTSTSCKAE